MLDNLTNRDKFRVYDHIIFKMPPKTGKSKAAIKAETTDKVRELRLRQQKWMEERDSAIKPGPSRGTTRLSTKDSVSSKATKPSSATQGVIKLLETMEKENHPKSATPTQAKNNFQSWRVNRNNTTPAQDHLLDNVELRFSEEPSQLENVETTSEFASEDLPPFSTMNTARSETSTIRDIESELDHDEDSQNQISEKYEMIADDIVNRVKQEMTLEQRAHSSGRHTSEGGEKSGSQGSPLKAEQPHSLSSFSSHSCPICHKLMLGSTNSAYLLIPCGHTSCQTCFTSQSSRNCPVCATVVQSATPNIMLQQIISEYHRKDARPGSETAAAREPVACDHSGVLKPSKGQVDEVRNCMGRTYTQMPNGPPQKSAAEYEEEYRNLLLRCDVLREEEISICDKMAALDRAKDAESRQIDNIDGAQQRLKAEIEALHVKINDLERHKTTYREKIEDLESQRNKERRKLEMVKTTVTQLKEDIKKIKSALSTTG